MHTSLGFFLLTEMRPQFPKVFSLFSTRMLAILDKQMLDVAIRSKAVQVQNAKAIQRSKESYRDLTRYVRIFRAASIAYSSKSQRR
jgi:hypothetical protein